MPWMYFIPTCKHSGRYWSWVHPKSQIWRKHQEILYHITKRFISQQWAEHVSRGVYTVCIDRLWCGTVFYLMPELFHSLSVRERQKTSGDFSPEHITQNCLIEFFGSWRRFCKSKKKILCSICGADSAYFQVEIHSAKKQLVHLSNDVCKRNTCVGYRFTQSGWHTQTHAAVF